MFFFLVKLNKARMGAHSTLFTELCRQHAEPGELVEKHTAARERRGIRERRKRGCTEQGLPGSSR